MGCNCGKKKSVAQPRQQKIAKTTPSKTGSDKNPNPRIIRRKMY